MTMIEDNIRHLPRLRIGEAMKLFDMTARAIRYYEERGLIDARRDRMNSRYL
jgi:DNA-binding transcriptional MerR regulator